MKLSLPLIGLVATGLILASQKKSSNSSTSSSSNKIFKWNCGSIKIYDSKEFALYVMFIVEQMMKQTNVDIITVSSLDPLQWSKKFISKINPSCNKLPDNMNTDEKICYALMSSAAFDAILFHLFKITDYTPEKYPDEAVICVRDNNDKKGDCMFRLNPHAEGFGNIKNMLEDYKQIILIYLGLNGKEEIVKSAKLYLAANMQYP